MSTGPALRLAGFLARWRNALFSMTDHLWLLLLWAVSTPVFISRLGPEDFGIWILINAIIGLGGVLSLGFGEATIRYVSKYRGLGQPEEIRRIVDSTLGLYGLIGLLSGAGLALAAPAIARGAFHLSGPEADPAVSALRLAALGLAITAWLKTYEAVLNGFERFDLSAKIGMVSRSFIILGNLALTLAGFGLVALISCAVLGLLGQAIACFVICRTRFAPWLRVISLPDPATTSEIAGFGLQSWLQICGGALTTIADRFLVGVLIDPATAGVYALCLQLAQQIHLLVTRALAFLSPAASRATARGRDTDALLHSYRAACVIVLLLAGAVAVPLYSLAPQIQEVWLGAAFAAQGAVTLRLMTLYFAVWGLVVPMIYLLNGTGNPGWNTGATLTYGVIGLALCALLLPRLGIEGAAVARMAALPAYLPILWVLHRHVLAGRGWRISLGAMAWLGLLGLLAQGLSGFASSRVSATWSDVLTWGVALAVLGGGVALVPRLVARWRAPAAA